MPSDFERELEGELHRCLDPLGAAPIPPRTVPAPGGRVVELLAGSGAALAAKLVMGIAIVAFATSVAGVATEAVITRSLSPVEWSHQARHQVLALQSQDGPVVSHQHAATSPAAHLAGANGSGQQPATGLPANPPQESPEPNSVTVPPIEGSSSPKPTPPKCGPTSTETAGGC